jgi:F0F1-type ATP synthase membrane subunit b/b'
VEPFHWFVEYIVPYLNFLIFLAILVFFARKPLMLLASKRKSTFDDHYKSSSETLTSFRHQFEELQKRYKTLDHEMSLMTARALQDAQLEANRIIEDGKRQARQVLEDAKKMRDAEYLEAQKELGREALSLTKAALIEKLEKDFDGSKDQLFTEKRLNEMSGLTIADLGRV